MANLSVMGNLSIGKYQGYLREKPGEDGVIFKVVHHNYVVLVGHHGAICILEQGDEIHIDEPGTTDATLFVGKAKAGAIRLNSVPLEEINQIIFKRSNSFWKTAAATREIDKINETLEGLEDISNDIW